MSRAINCEISREEAAEHPAVQAWRRLGPERAKPERIEVLKQKPKSAVFRLAGMGPDGSALIAKRCLKSTAFTERLIYEECLPRLPIPGRPQLYGFVAEGEYCWLFLEDAAGNAYSPDNNNHRGTAGRWLGLLHAAAADESWPRRLPERGTDHYLGVLQSAHASAMEFLSHPALPCEDTPMLLAVAKECRVVKSRWKEVEAFCKTFPPAVVHGDLAVKNVYLRTIPAGLTLLAFDWENAGWGVPAADLCQSGGGMVLSPDLCHYCDALEHAGRRLELRRAQKLAAYGRVFRLLDAIGWEAASVDFNSRERLADSMSRIRSYERDMAGAFSDLKWAGVSRQ